MSANTHLLYFPAKQAEPIRREARLAMIKKVRQLRRAHELAAARVAASVGRKVGDETAGDGGGTGQEGDGSEGAGAMAKEASAGLEASMPEYVLPYAIHLLAHHPEFPVDKVR